MAELDEQTRRDLARLRERGAPSAAAKQRMLAALEVQLGPEGGDDPSGDPSSGDGGAGSGQLAWTAKVVGATAALTAGGLAAVRVSVELVRALSGTPQASPPRETETVQASEPAPEHAQVDAQIDSMSPRDVEPAEGVRADEALEPKQAEASEPKRRTDTASSPAPVDRDTLAAELALLEAARTASDPAAALVELERHLARFPTGALADERELLRIEMLCKLGRLDEARSLSEHFLATRPTSALRGRLASACKEK